MNDNTKNTCCFSGYRPGKFTFELKDSSPEYLRLVRSVRQAVKDSAQAGYTRFLCGMAAGFDIICGEAVAWLKRSDLNFRFLSLVAVVPFLNHGSRGRVWGLRHSKLMEQAEETVYISMEYRPDCYRRRNRYMVDRSSRLICYWDGERGGTANTIAYARRSGMEEIINIAE